MQPQSSEGCIDAEVISQPSPATLRRSRYQPLISWMPLSLRTRSVTGTSTDRGGDSLSSGLGLVVVDAQRTHIFDAAHRVVVRPRRRLAAYPERIGLDPVLAGDGSQIGVGGGYGVGNRRFGGLRGPRLRGHTRLGFGRRLRCGRLRCGGWCGFGLRLAAAGAASRQHRYPHHNCCAHRPVSQSHGQGGKSICPDSGFCARRWNPATDAAARLPWKEARRAFTRDCCAASGP